MLLLHRRLATTKLPYSQLITSCDTNTREIELPVSENSAAILETDDLQDIPEDDDMIVLE